MLCYLLQWLSMAKKKRQIQDCTNPHSFRLTTCFLLCHCLANSRRRRTRRGAIHTYPCGEKTVLLT